MVVLIAIVNSQPFSNSKNDKSSNHDPMDVKVFAVYGVRGAFPGVPITRTITFWGPYWVPYLRKLRYVL